MRARKPDRSGRADNEGVEIHYDVYGDADVTVLFLPAWAISDSRLWKAQIAFFARHYRVITYDPRGNGRSDRPEQTEAYGARELMGDALAVLDAVGARQAFVVGNSFGSIVAYLLSSMHQGRVLGAVHIGTTLNLEGETESPLARAIQEFEREPDTWRDWNLYRRTVWNQDFPRFVEFFVQQAMSEPHSSRLIEQGIEWGLQTSGETLAHTVLARGKAPPEAARQWLLRLGQQIRCPSLVIHGDDDKISPVQWGRRLAEVLGVEPVILEDAGHCPQARHPARLNPMIHAFIQRAVQPIAPSSEAAEPARRVVSAPPRVLYLSSPIGLGHVRRDLAIADALRRRIPDLQIDWLAQDPVTRFLEARGERVHPASAFLASESRHLENEAGEHDLDVFEAFRRMDEILIANYMVFLELVARETYDLVIGDEAWEVDHFLHEAPEHKRTRFAWLTDFVGYLPMPGGGERQRVLAADYNAEMIAHVERHPKIRDCAIFVGNPDDVVDHSFGDGLPSIRTWTEANYAFSGYIAGFDPSTLSDRAALRHQLGYAPDEVVVVASVGGSGVGTGLLEKVVGAHRRLREAVPTAKTVLVTGPRIDPARLPDAPGLQKHAFVPELPRHLAASDFAVVQGGLSTTMELVACRRPFAYVPLRNHFEQQIHVRHRLERYGAGRPLDFHATSADQMALAILEGMKRGVQSRPVETDGAERAADMLVQVIGAAG